MTEKNKYTGRELSMAMSGSFRDADNLAIWVKGNTPGYGRETLQGLIYSEKRDIDSQISNLRTERDSFGIKSIKGKEYWYRWTQSGWKYVSPKNGNDPQAPYNDKITALEEEMKKISERIKKCVVKELGDHLLIDMYVYKKNVGKSLPNDIIKLSDVV